MGHNVKRMRAGRCQDLARTDWVPEPSARAVLAGDELWIGSWRCKGEQRPWNRESVRHAAIEMMEEGVHLRELRGRRVVVEPTMAVLHPAADEFRMASPTGRPQRSTILYLRGALLDELCLEVPRVQPLDVPTALLHRRLLVARAPVAQEEAALELVHALAGNHVRSPAVRGRPPASWRQLAEEAQHVIAARFGESLTLQLLARAIGASAFHLSRVFRAVTGDTVHRYLIRVRLRVALYALARSEAAADLSQIALACGFSSHSHFTSAFRAEFGVPPSQLRPAKTKTGAM